MAQRILGPTGSRRRRRFLVLPVLLVMAFALFWIVGAQAVHDTGRFQLDGDAVSATLGTPPATDDWDKVCYQVVQKSVADGGEGLTAAQAAARCGIATATTGATSTAWTAEPDPSASIFTGGGSKDPIDLNQWAWKDAGGLPDKDNLVHGFAARYSLTPSATCPAGTFSTCELLFFGSDRFDNSGDAQQGVWFFQSKVTAAGAKSGGGTGFTGQHKTGDVLVISDFSIGGTVSTITIYRWEPACTKAGQVLPAPPAGSGNTCGDTNLETLRTSTAANCATPGLSGDNFCGLVNPSTVTMPWSFTDKSGTPANGALNGELYEGGINLSTLGLANECFSSVLLETRSSTSTTATLKDFVLGQLGQCKPTMTTQASSNGTVLPGVSVTDTATIKIEGAAAPTDPTGSVTFFLCSNATNGCPSPSGTSIGTGTLGGAPTNDGIASATSPAVNTSGSPLAPGRYCFRAEWPGDSNYAGVSHTNNTTECFSVKDTTAITTAQFWYPQDTASITTGSGAAAPTGTVVFTLYDSNNCTGTVLGTFNDATAPYSTNNQTTVSVNTTKSVSWSATFTPDDTNGFAGSTTTRCERSDLTINNSASNFPPGP